jgi:hypothetical protein
MPDRLLLHAARTRDAMRVDRGPDLSGRWTERTHAMIRELTNLVAAEMPAGADRRIAEYAVTRWITLRGRTIRQCMAEQWLSKDHRPENQRPSNLLPSAPAADVETRTRDQSS